MHAQSMLATHPAFRGETNNALSACIEACYDCAQTCTACADACLAEPGVAELARCIRLDLDCADICGAAGAIASRAATGMESPLHAILIACADVCRLCAAECGVHAARHAHCRVCAEACARCDAACRGAAATILPTLQ